MKTAISPLVLLGAFSFGTWLAGHTSAAEAAPAPSQSIRMAVVSPIRIFNEMQETKDLKQKMEGDRANLANIELHTSLARTADLDRPDSLVFDLDPGAPADIVDCARVAIRLRGLFNQLGLECYAKTSGSKGLHLHAPLNGTATFAESRPFAKAVAETFEARFPDEVVSRQTKTRREGRVLIDWSQNDAHKTTASVYSIRARERPTASTPLEWEEVEAIAESGDAAALGFTVEDLRRRIAAKGDLYAPLLTQKQELPDLSV